MRVLVIVSTDYGELGNALHFLNGLNAGEAPVVMLPAALAHAVPPRPDLTLSVYETLADIRARIVAFEPDAVMFFSGYLLTVGKRFSVFNTLGLLQWLRGRGVTVLTSDPFLGLLSSPSALDFAPVLGGSNALLRRVRSWTVALRLYVLRLRLRDVMHVYPAPIARLHAGGRGVVRRGYASPPTLSDGGAEQRPGEAPSWIFVLSDIDYRMQLSEVGERFATQLCERLRDAVCLGRRPVLVAPPALLAAVGAQLGPDCGIEMRSRDSYPAFMAKLMAAEYAFFWNLYSFSLLHRVLARLPVMFFHEGHMVRILPALHEAGIRLFYNGWRPPLLAMDAPLREADLHHLAEETRARFDTVALGMRQCDEPLALLREALSANERNVVDAQA